MTIRFACKECESVLKIRSELAGTKANCPKCKTPFVVPESDSEPEGTERKSGKSRTEQNVSNSERESDDLENAPVDCPQEVTPQVDPADTDLFDAPKAPVSSTATSGAPRPSVAELMREHEATKKKKTEKKKKTGSLEAAAAAAEIATAGTAADALTRTYDQKRGKASDPAPMTREERRAAEEKAAFKHFAIRGAIALAALAICMYAVVWIMAWFALPPLETVTGKVTFGGAPLSRALVTFTPVNKNGAKTATPSTGWTDESGEYELWYEQDVTKGVVPDTHTVTIMSDGGGMFGIPEPDRRKDVKEGAENRFDFNLMP